MVGQFIALGIRLPQLVGRVMLITDQAHRDRALAIARLALACQGLQVQAPPPWRLRPVFTPDDLLRLHCDVLRVQLWRISGWDGREQGLRSGRCFP